MALEAVQQGGLIGMDDPPRAGDLDELGLVDLPRSTPRGDSVGSLRGERVDALARPRVVDVPKVVERPIDRQPGLLQRLAACGLLEALVRIRRAFRDAPRRAPVVVAGRMYEQHLDRALDHSVKDDARRELCT